jgi:hypothetical protein
MTHGHTHNKLTQAYSLNRTTFFQKTQSMNTYAIFDTEAEAIEKSEELAERYTGKGYTEYSEIRETNDGSFCFPISTDGYFDVTDKVDSTEELDEADLVDLLEEALPDG